MYSKPISKFRELLIENLTRLPELVMDNDDNEINLQEKVRAVLKSDDEFNKLMLNFGKRKIEFQKMHNREAVVSGLINSQFRLFFNVLSHPGINVNKEDKRSIGNSFRKAFVINNKLWDKNYTLELDTQIKKAFDDHNLNCESSKLCNVKNPENSKNIKAVVSGYMRDCQELSSNQSTLFCYIPNEINQQIEKNLECPLTCSMK